MNWMSFPSIHVTEEGAVGRPELSLETQHLQGVLSQLPPALFLQVIEQSPIAISVTDLEAHIIYSNQAFSTLTGYSQSELKGSNHNLLASQQTPKSRYQAMWSALSDKRHWSGRLINRRKDGSLYLAEVTVTPVLDERRQTSYYLGMHRDISEHYALEQRLKNQKALLEAVLNAAPTAVAVLDDQHHILLDNLAYKTLRSDLQGVEPLTVLEEAEAQESSAPPLVALTIRGQVRWFSRTRQPMESLNEEAAHYFGQGKRPYTLLLIQDQTERHQQQELDRLEQLRLQLEEQRLISTIHEALDAASLQLLGPLNLLQAAQRLEPDGGGHRAITAALTEGERARQWLQNARPSQSREPVSCFELGLMLADLQALTLGSPYDELSCQVELPARPLFVEGQRLRLMMAVQQLMTLARQRTSGLEGVIRLSLRPAEQNVQLQLEDNGALPEEIQLGRVLPFNCLVQDESGTGIALSLVQGIVNDHSGVLSVTASELGGCLVLLELPLLLNDRRSS